MGDYADKGYTTIDQPTPRPPWLQLAPYVMLTNSTKELPLLIDPNAFEAESDALESNAQHPPFPISFTQISFVNLDTPQHEIVAHVPIIIQIPRG